MTPPSVAAVREILAVSFRAACRDAGVDVPPTLGLAATTPNSDVEPIVLDSPWELGLAHERLTSNDEQVRRGAWYTPRAVAEHLVATTIDAAGAVFDPACGGGVFLLAAADRLVALGVDPSVALGSVSGADVDPLAVAVTEAALWWWGARHGLDQVPTGLVVADTLVDDVWSPVRYVVGNPPFLGQLRSITSGSPDYRAALRARFGTAVRAYTERAALFVLAAVESVTEDGAVTLIQPRSVLGARDTREIRARIDDVADIDSCWFGDGGTFDASVEVCAPTLRRRSASGSSVTRRPWTAWLCDHLGLPDVDLGAGAGADVASVATVLAGFRDQYYGLVDAVVEGGAGPRLVTSGVIDPFELCLDRSVTFAKARWDDPHIDVARVDPKASAWVERQRCPSVLVASQTRIVECAVDSVGDVVIGVPGLCVVPTDDVDVWHLAAALGAPCVSAWMARRSIGTGMSAETFRITATLVGSVPLPTDDEAWDRAADLVRRIGDGDHGEATWREFAAAADAAHRIDDEGVVAWWWDHHPHRRSAPPM